ncbi:MAG TPA: YIP1 family protein [Bryobacteraceae bacterium]|nr:YIP1 family protein [Bryobacteraceae bacterium]
MAEETPSAASGILGMFNAFVDPAGLAKAAKAKLFWLWPLILLCIIFFIVGNLMLPYSLQLGEARLAQQNVPPERLESARNMTRIITSVVVYLIPVFIVLFNLLIGWLINVTGSMVGLKAKFRDVFSILMATSLIGSLQFIATYIVLRTKGDEITSQEQMSPAFGLDIFIPAHGVLLAILNFFSIFEIWSLVILALALASLTGSTKGKAFAAITPAWVIPLIFKIIGALFTPSSS